MVAGNFCQVVWAGTRSLGIGCARSPKTGKVLNYYHYLSIIPKQEICKLSCVNFFCRWLWWHSTTHPGTWETTARMCFHRWMIPLADINFSLLTSNVLTEINIVEQTQAIIVHNLSYVVYIG